MYSTKTCVNKILDELDSNPSDCDEACGNDTEIVQSDTSNIAEDGSSGLD